jgi:hypothetical protein
MNRISGKTENSRRKKIDSSESCQRYLKPSCPRCEPEYCVYEFGGVPSESHLKNPSNHPAQIDSLANDDSPYSSRISGIFFTYREMYHDNSHVKPPTWPDVFQKDSHLHSSHWNLDFTGSGEPGAMSGFLRGNTQHQHPTIH